MLLLVIGHIEPPFSNGDFVVQVGAVVVKNKLKSARYNIFLCVDSGNCDTIVTGGMIRALIPFPRCIPKLGTYPCNWITILYGLKKRRAE